MKLTASAFFRCESQAVAVEPRTPQARFPLHDHDFNEIAIVVSGNGWHVLNEEPRLITCGELLYIRAEDRHAFEQVNDLVLTNVLYRPSDRLLGPERLRALLGGTGEAAGVRCYWQLAEDVLTADVKPLLQRLTAECANPDALAEVMAEALFVQLAVTLRRHRFATDGELLPAHARLGHVLTHLRHSCTEPVDFDEIAHRFGYSLRNFNRVFREATATSPHNYLVSLRIGRAMRALRTTEDSITDVAFSSGFNDSNYFSYCFSKMTGVSPREYRRLARARGGAPPEDPG